MSTCVIEVFAERLKASWRCGSPPEALYEAAVRAVSELYAAEVRSRSRFGLAADRTRFSEGLFLGAALQSLDTLYSHLPIAWRSGEKLISARTYAGECALGLLLPPHVVLCCVRPYFDLRVQKEGMFRDLREKINANFSNAGHVPLSRICDTNAFQIFLDGTPLLQIFQAVGPVWNCSHPARVQKHG